MKLVNQSHLILKLDCISSIEHAGRVCYKSDNKIGCTLDECVNIENQKCGFCEHHSSFTFTKKLIKQTHDAMLEHGSATVKFITDRGVTHELVRHRIASYGQESTRFVNYKSDDIQFIRPVWFGQNEIGDKIFLKSCLQNELDYKNLINIGWTPEKARSVLNNSLKTEIVVTANYREWRHIMKLRAIGTTGRPHPQMEGLMLPLLAEFQLRIPCLFNDLMKKNNI